MADITAGGTAGAIAACSYLAGASIVEPFLGLHIDAVVVGFVAGVAVQLHVPPKEGERTPTKLFALACAASFFAGIFSPIAASLLVDKIGCLQGMTYASTRLVCAAGIAVGVFGLPILRDWAQKKWGGA